MAASWIHAAVQFDFELAIAAPAELSPDAEILQWAKAQGGKITVTSDVDAADGEGR